MLIFGCLLIPLVFAAPSESPRENYVPKIEGGVLKSIEVIGEPPESLDLSGHGIRSIEDKIFQNLTRVKRINLGNNLISFLPRSTFSNLRDLEYLCLADNAISSLENGGFSDLSKLKFLNISNNPIRELPQGRFYGLGKSTNISASFPHGLSILHTLMFDFFYDIVMDHPVFCPVTSRPDVDDQKIVCIRDGVVEKLIPFAEVMKPHCKLVSCLGSGFKWFRRLNLDNLAISEFTSGWYFLYKDVNVLSVKNNEITDITAEFLNDLPADVQHVDVSNNKIGRLERGIIVNEYLTFLNLSSNFIVEIEDEALTETNLVVVDLRRNRLNNTRFVATLPSTLLSLRLSDNCINELLPDVFSRFPELSTVDFAGNDITVIKRESLRGLHSAKDLNLSKNKIEKIEAGAFRNLSTLSNLNLANNKLTSLDKGVLDGLYFLKYLDLSSNNIQKITHDSFRGLMGAGGQSLSYKLFGVAEIVTFRRTQEYRPYLNCYEKKRIDNETSGSSVLLSLSLQNNSLSQINGDEFVALDQLELLDLSSNRISKIEKGFAKYLGNVTELILSDNPIVSLENGALFGLRKRYRSIVRLNNVQLRLLQGGVFDDL